MAFVLGPGLLTNPNFYSRIEYIKTNTLWWQLGWSVWIFTAFTFFVFTVCLWRHHLALGTSSFNRKLLITAVDLAAVAVLLDSHAELGQILDVTALVSHYGEGPIRKEFIASQVLFMFESGTVANFMYCLATNCSVIATKNHYPKWLFNVGLAVFFVGLIASGLAFIAGFLCGDMQDNPLRTILVATNAILFPLLVLWQLGIAYKSKGENNA
ncbi:hypothetical protein KA183_06230 [bacterium]|nr:hypothetical protein [bacterium]QQR56286.1 MAG: hypothetical protein IPG59_14890 [Candidatus Melainabacteria bacterium]